MSEQREIKYFLVRSPSDMSAGIFGAEETIRGESGETLFFVDDEADIEQIREQLRNAFWGRWDDPAIIVFDFEAQAEREAEDKRLIELGMEKGMGAVVEKVTDSAIRTVTNTIALGIQQEVKRAETECADLLRTVLGLRLDGRHGMPLTDFIPTDLVAECRDAIARAKGRPF